MMDRLERGYLLLAGAVAIAIGLGMVGLPEAFYGGYGIDPTTSADLGNELRSPGLWLGIVGIAIGLGTIRSGMRVLSLGIAAAFYLSYAAARTISIVLDGVPQTGLLIAMASEIVLGGVGLLLWHRRLTSARRAR